MPFTLAQYQAPDFGESRFADAPDVRLIPVSRDGVAPDDYHATSIFPEYFKVNGRWLLAEQSRMDCVAVYENNQIHVREFRRLCKGDLVAIGRTEGGSEGILVHMNGFLGASVGGSSDGFAFRQGRSRETAFSMDYDRLYDLLRFERDNGYIVWVLGPALSFDADSRAAFAALIDNGYAHALLAGNALATHDLEGAYRKTALGQDIYTQALMPNGHYNHIDTINRVRLHGSIPAFIEAEGIRDGIIPSCVRKGVPFVLTGSIRDDGPLPEVFADVYAGQDAMRTHLSRATTVIAMATALHTIAAGNITPTFRVMADGAVRPVHFYVVDISEFTANKLADRGSLAARSIITNVQDFIVNVHKGLCG
ncbi:MAG: hypothetical protein LBB86_01675 [Oscillospiraceae bacterium]|nr:hypothetical protein [Oscillospiraceae bacterium]